MINELKRLRDWYRHSEEDISNELDAIIRKYEEPTETMVGAGRDALFESLGGHEPVFDSDARACFKAMMEAEDKGHE